jgi:hypothetical protein
MTCSAFQDDLAAYALGTLGGDDRTQVDAHLLSCADCQAQLEDFAILVPLLERTTADDVISASGPVPDLLPRTLAVLRARRRRRIWLSAAAAVVLVTGAVGTTVAVTRPDTPPSRIVVQAQDATTHVSAKVSYLPSAGGTNLWLVLSGVASGEHCQLVAVGDGGKREVAATWQATYHGEAKVQGMTAFTVTSLRGFEITTTAGRHLVWVDTPKAS